MRASHYRGLSLRSTGSRRAGSVVVAHRSSCSAACGIFPDQGSNPCPLLWQADSQPLRHQGSPKHIFLKLLLGLCGLVQTDKIPAKKLQCSGEKRSQTNNSIYLYFENNVVKCYEGEVQGSITNLKENLTYLKESWKYFLKQNLYRDINGQVWDEEKSSKNCSV